MLAGRGDAAPGGDQFNGKVRRRGVSRRGIHPPARRAADLRTHLRLHLAPGRPHPPHVRVRRGWWSGDLANGGVTPRPRTCRSTPCPPITWSGMGPTTRRLALLPSTPCPSVVRWRFVIVGTAACTMPTCPCCTSARRPRKQADAHVIGVWCRALVAPVPSPSKRADRTTFPKNAAPSHRNGAKRFRTFPTTWSATTGMPNPCLRRAFPKPRLSSCVGPLRDQGWHHRDLHSVCSAACTYELRADTGG